MTEQLPGRPLGTRRGGLMSSWQKSNKSVRDHVILVLFGARTTRIVLPPGRLHWIPTSSLSLPMAVIEEVTDDAPAPAPPAKKEKVAFIPADKFEVRRSSAPRPFRKAPR